MVLSTFGVVLSTFGVVLSTFGVVLSTFLGGPVYVWIGPVYFSGGPVYFWGGPVYFRCGPVYFWGGPAYLLGGPTFWVVLVYRSACILLLLLIRNHFGAASVAACAVAGPHLVDGDASTGCARATWSPAGGGAPCAESLRNRSGDSL